MNSYLSPIFTNEQLTVSMKKNLERAFGQFPIVLLSPKQRHDGPWTGLQLSHLQNGLGDNAAWEMVYIGVPDPALETQWGPIRAVFFRCPPPEINFPVVSKFYYRHVTLTNAQLMASLR